MKSQDLQKFRGYYQICPKQCRGQNSFKYHWSKYWKRHKLSSVGKEAKDGQTKPKSQTRLIDLKIETQRLQTA